MILAVGCAIGLGQLPGAPRYVLVDSSVAMIEARRQTRAYSDHQGRGPRYRPADGSTGKRSAS